MWPLVTLITHTHSAVPVLSVSELGCTNNCLVGQAGQERLRCCIARSSLQHASPRLTWSAVHLLLQHTAPWSGASGCPVQHLHTLVVPCLKAAVQTGSHPTAARCHRSSLLLGHHQVWHLTAGDRALLQAKILIQPMVQEELLVQFVYFCDIPPLFQREKP